MEGKDILWPSQPLTFRPLWPWPSPNFRTHVGAKLPFRPEGSSNALSGRKRDLSLLEVPKFGLGQRLKGTPFPLPSSWSIGANSVHWDSVYTSLCDHPFTSFTWFTSFTLIQIGRATLPGDWKSQASPTKWGSLGAVTQTNPAPGFAWPHSSFLCILLTHFQLTLHTLDNPRHPLHSWHPWLPWHPWHPWHPWLPAPNSTNESTWQPSSVWTRSKFERTFFVSNQAGDLGPNLVTGQMKAKNKIRKLNIGQQLMA